MFLSLVSLEMQSLRLRYLVLCNISNDIFDSLASFCSPLAEEQTRGQVMSPKNLKNEMKGEIGILLAGKTGP